MKTEAEQQVWNECSRLIANAIIYCNTLLLSWVYEQRLAAGDHEAITILKGISPVARRNVNLIGNFDFTTGSSPVDIEADEDGPGLQTTLLLPFRGVGQK